MLPLTKPLTATARRALCASIRKWSLSINRYGTLNCYLCWEFHTDHQSENPCCFGCPVMEVSGQRFCQGTPYWYGDLSYQDSESYRINELDFLLSILIQDRKLRKSLGEL